MAEKKKLDKLTPEQEAMKSIVRDEWIAHGLSTEPADRELAEEGIRESYTLVGLKEPEQIVWYLSPNEARMRAAMWVNQGTLEGDPGKVTNEQLREQLNRSLWGQHDAGWLAWCDFWERIGFDFAAQSAGLRKVGKSAHWWWAMEDIAIISDRPCELYRDDNGRMHNDSGMSIKYRDGWGFYVWHGIRVPEWVIMDPTIKRIQKESNTEVRRCAIENFGWDRYLDELGVKPVSVEDDPANPGFKLSLYDIPSEHQVYDDRVRLVVMHNASRDRNGSRRIFAETVPVDCKTAVEASAWQFGVDVETYRSMQRAT
jgi:hypothetical protein